MCVKFRVCRVCDSVCMSYRLHAVVAEGNIMTLSSELSIVCIKCDTIEVDVGVVTCVCVYECGVHGVITIVLDMSAHCGVCGMR